MEKREGNLNSGMSDLEMTRLCAVAMGLPSPTIEGGGVWIGRHSTKGFSGREVRAGGMRYDPLNDDALAMALVKRFGLTCDPEKDEPPYGPWRICAIPVGSTWNQSVDVENDDLNRAIVECVANMQALVSGQAAQRDDNATAK